MNSLRKASVITEANLKRRKKKYIFQEIVCKQNTGTWRKIIGEQERQIKIK